MVGCLGLFCGVVKAEAKNQGTFYGLKIDEQAKITTCRTMPFLAALPENRGATTRMVDGEKEIIPVNAKAEALYVLGLINEGWDMGVAHWGEHPELRSVRDDQLYVGSIIGELEIQYADGQSDRVPLQIGATAWFMAGWAYGPTHNVTTGVQEPFASRPDYMEVLRESLKLYEDDRAHTTALRHQRYYLALKPKDKVIKQIVVHDQTSLRGRPLISAITVKADQPGDNLLALDAGGIAEADKVVRVEASSQNDFGKETQALARILYTHEDELPKTVAVLDFPQTLAVAKIRFKGGKTADMLWNIWVQNITSLNEKFNADTGFFDESGVGYPWYGGYSGIGTWAGLGIYRGTAFARSADHFATLVMRCLENDARRQNFIDFCDKYLYYYRANHDPNMGPDNSGLDIGKYPKDAPPHWGFGINTICMVLPINEIPGDEETDGHGSTAVARWYAWRLLGCPKGEWLTAPRAAIYGKSRYDSTRDAAEFICWLMDYTAKDVMWCEGESTGWAGIIWGPDNNVLGLRMVPQGMAQATDPAVIKKNYANCNHMYQMYPTYICMTALRCSAQMAEAAGRTEDAQQWRQYADRLQTGMLRELFVGDWNNRQWRVSPYSVFPSLQESLVQGFFSIYLEGYDSKRWQPEMAEITRNTLRRHLDQAYGHAPVLGMGYGIGWLTHASLSLDYMDDAGKLIENTVKYTYDKNMDYVDEARGIDWRRWLWLIPEGTHILPDGSWYRIGDLTNGANQGPVMQALGFAAGVDDTRPDDLRIMPRVPDPMTGIEVSDFGMMAPGDKGLTQAKVTYSYDKATARFDLSCLSVLPTLSVRVGPFDRKRAEGVMNAYRGQTQGAVRMESSGFYQEQEAWWVWIEGMKNVQTVRLDAP